MRTEPSLNRVLAVMLLLLSISLTAQAQESETVQIQASPLRNWTSADGRFSVEGALIEVAGEKIRLQSDGRAISVLVAKLSPADQEFVQAELERVKSNDENPFMVESESSANPFESDQSSPQSPRLVVDPDFLNCPAIALETRETVDLDAAHWKPLPRTPVKTFRAPAYSIHSTVTGCVSNSAETLLAVSFHEPFGINLSARPQTGNQNSVKSWVEFFDLPGSKSQGRFPLTDEQSLVADLDSKGARLLTRDGIFSQTQQIRIYAVEESALRLQSSWLSKAADGRSQPATSARFLDDEHVVVEYPGQLIVWNLKNMQPLHQVPNDDLQWQLANDRRRALVSQRGQKFEVDLIAGECLGSLGGPIDSQLERVASPDGRHFATIKDSTLVIRDNDGALQDEFYAPVFWPQPNLVWLDQNTIRVDSPNQTHFVDVGRRIVLIEISNSGPNPPEAKWFTRKVNQDNSYFVEIGQQVEPRMMAPDLDSYRRQAGQDAASLLIFQPGDRVSLSLRLDAETQHRELISKTVTNLLEARGVVVDESAPDQVRVNTAQRSEEIEYRRIGVPPWDANAVEKVQVRVVEQRLEFVRNGQVLWQRSSATGPGFMLHMRDGESAQQAVNRQMGDGSAFWSALTLPKHVAKHPGGGAWFKLHKTEQGYQEMK